MILKAKKYGNSMYFLVPPQEVKARDIKDGEYYEVVWKGKMK